MESIPKKHYQVIIIGGGPAGLSAGFWCAELGLEALLLESADELGGQLLWTYNAIRNHLGIEVENGRELQKVFLKQLESHYFAIKTDCRVVEIDAQNRQVKLNDNSQLSADVIIIATGIRRRKIGLENEEKFKGHGIIESGKRDGEKVRGKKVSVVGGGDAALENALILSEFAEKVTLIHRRRNFRARPEFIEKVQQNEKIEILTETIVTGLIGDKNLEAIELKTKTETHLYQTDFLLLRLGVEPNTEFLRGQIDLDENGYCRIDAHCETNLTNVYAVGDVANPLAPTISGAVGMGASVAKIIAQKFVQ